MKIYPAANINNLNIKPQKQNTPSFKGSKEGFITRTLNNTIHLDKHIAKGVAKLSQTKFSDRLVDFTRKLPNPPARWADLESFAVTFFYMWNTWKSDKIDEERKIPSMIQNGAVTIASSLAALAIDELCSPLINKLTLAYKNLPPEKIAELGGKSAKEFFDASNKLKSNTVFTAVVRFIVPVLMVPAVGKIVAALKKKSAEKTNEQNPQNQQQQQNPVEQPAKLNTMQGYAPQIHFDNQNENKFKSLFA